MKNFCFQIVIFILIEVLNVCGDKCPYEDTNKRTAYMYCMKDCCGDFKTRYCCGPPRLSAGAVVGIAVGCIAGLVIGGIIITLCVIYCCSKTRGRSGKVITQDEVDIRIQPPISETSQLRPRLLPPLQISSNYRLSSTSSMRGPIVTIDYSGSDGIHDQHEQPSSSGGTPQPPSYDEIYQQKQ